MQLSQLAHLQGKLPISPHISPYLGITLGRTPTVQSPHFSHISPHLPISRQLVHRLQRAPHEPLLAREMWGR